MGEGTGMPGTSGRDAELRRELDDEIEAHVAMRADELVAGGMDPVEARREALRRFGDVEGARRTLLATARRRERRRRWARGAEGVRRDAAHAFRRIRRSPGFAALSVLIFALGVGVTTAMFAVIDHVLLRRLPFPHPEELVALGSVSERGEPFYLVSMGNWVDWRASRALASTGLFASGAVTVTGRGDAFRAPSADVAGAFFETLRPRMVAGRAFTEEDGQSRAPVAVVSERFWRGVLAGAPMDGTTLEVDGRTVDVVGVVARGHGLPADADVWLPTPWRPEPGGMRNNINWQAVARLAPDLSADDARRDLATVAAGIRESDPEGIYSWGVGVEPLNELVAGGVRRVLRVLMASVLFVLLAACANLAGLGLARGRRRAAEMATRLALGAGRGQLLRQLLAEQMTLALLGGAFGLALAWWSTEWVLRYASDLLPRAAELGFDLRVAAFGLVATLASGLLTAVAPALRTSHGHGPGARGNVRGGKGLPGSIMVATEVALAVALLVGGGLLLRSFLAASSRDLGFDPEGVVTVDVALTNAEYSERGRSLAYWEDLMERERAVPGVEAVAISNAIPTGGGGVSFIEIEGDDRPNQGAGYRVVSDDYFAVLGIPVRTGRAFAARDDAGTERVGVVNESFAHTFWPDGTAIGRRFRAPSMEAWFAGGQAEWIRVVGVVGDTRHYGFESDPRPDVFVLYRQMPAYTRFMTAVARLRPGAPATIADTMRATARAVDASLAVRARMLEDRVRALLAERRLTLAVVGAFAVAGLLLVCLGVYGLISFAVSERTREIAVRAALGLDRMGILTLMLGSALRVTLVGGAAGVLVALVSSRLMASLVVDVGTTDPLTYAVSAGLLVAVALIAALLPSARAARLDPLEALRSE